MKERKGWLKLNLVYDVVMISLFSYYFIKEGKEFLYLRKKEKSDEE